VSKPAVARLAGLLPQQAPRQEEQRWEGGMQDAFTQLHIYPVDSNVREALPACRYCCSSCLSSAGHLKFKPSTAVRGANKKQQIPHDSLNQTSLTPGSRQTRKGY